MTPTTRRIHAALATAVAAGCLATAAPASAAPADTAAVAGSRQVDVVAGPATVGRAQLLRRLDAKIVRVRAAGAVLTGLAAHIPDESGTVTWGPNPYRAATARQVTDEVELLLRWRHTAAVTDDPRQLTHIANALDSHHPVVAIAAEARALAGYSASQHDSENLYLTAQDALDEIGVVTDRTVDLLQERGSDTTPARTIEEQSHTDVVGLVGPAYDRQAALGAQARNLTGKRLAAPAFAPAAVTLALGFDRLHTATLAVQQQVAEVKRGAYEQLLALLETPQP